MNTSELAARAGLRPQGVVLALRKLTEAGVTQFVGVGSRQLVEFRSEHPLAEPVRAVFRAEQARVEALIQCLQQAARSSGSKVEAVWLEGAVAVGADAPGDAIVLGMLARNEHLAEALERLRAAAGECGKTHGVAIEIRSRSSADLHLSPESDREVLRQAVPVLGPPPWSLAPWGGSAGKSGRAATHASRDREALEVARIIAGMLGRDAGLVSRAKRHVAAQLQRGKTAQTGEWLEWQEILSNMSVARLRKFLTEDSERATRLRQTMPFAGALTASERAQAVSRAAAQAGVRAGVRAAAQPARRGTAQ